MEKEISKILVRMPQSLKDAIGSRAKEEYSLKREGVTV